MRYDNNTIKHSTPSPEPQRNFLAKLPAELMDAVVQLLPLRDQLHFAQTNRQGNGATARALALQAPALVLPMGASRQPALELLFDPRLGGPHGRALLAHHWERGTSSPLVRSLKYQLTAFQRISLAYSLNPLSWTRHAGLPLYQAAQAIEFATGQKQRRHKNYADSDIFGTSIYHSNTYWSVVSTDFEQNPGILFDTDSRRSLYPDTTLNLFTRDLACNISLKELLAWREYSPPRINAALISNVLKHRDLLSVGLPLLSNRRLIVRCKEEMTHVRTLNCAAANELGGFKDFIGKFFSDAFNRTYYRWAPAGYLAEIGTHVIKTLLNNPSAKPEDFVALYGCPIDFDLRMLSNKTETYDPSRRFSFFRVLLQSQHADRFMQNIIKSWNLHQPLISPQNHPMNGSVDPHCMKVFAAAFGSKTRSKPLSQVFVKALLANLDPYQQRLDYKVLLKKWMEPFFKEAVLAYSRTPLIKDNTAPSNTGYLSEQKISSLLNYAAILRLLSRGAKNVAMSTLVEQATGFFARAKSEDSAFERLVFLHLADWPLPEPRHEGGAIAMAYARFNRYLANSANQHRAVG